jgi:hypothetical protein
MLIIMSEGLENYAQHTSERRLLRRGCIAEFDYEWQGFVGVRENLEGLGITGAILGEFERGIWRCRNKERKGWKVLKWRLQCNDCSQERASYACRVVYVSNTHKYLHKQAG